MRDQAELDRLFDALDTVFFEGQLRAEGWTVRWRKFPKRKTSLCFGQCHLEAKEITINRVLGLPQVPTYVLMSTVFHEGVHAVAWDVDPGCDHGPGFQAMEMRYPHLLKSALWEKDNWAWLIANR